jgi:hypothetical protein
MILETRFEVQDDGYGGAYVFDRARGTHLRDPEGRIRLWDTGGQAEHWLDLEYPSWQSDPSSYWDEAAPDDSETTN